MAGVAIMSFDQNATTHLPMCSNSELLRLAYNVSPKVTKGDNITRLSDTYIQLYLVSL